MSFDAADWTHPDALWSPGAQVKLQSSACSRNQADSQHLSHRSQVQTLTLVLGSLSLRAGCSGPSTRWRNVLSWLLKFHSKSCKSWVQVVGWGLCWCWGSPDCAPPHRRSVFKGGFPRSDQSLHPPLLYVFTTRVIKTSLSEAQRGCYRQAPASLDGPPLRHPPPNLLPASKEKIIDTSVCISSLRASKTVKTGEWYKEGRRLWGWRSIGL